MGKKGEQKATVNKYLMSIHAGICAGPVDALISLWVGQKRAWTGEVLGSAGRHEIDIDNENLFGGPTEQGGISGAAIFLPGKADQTLGDGIASRFGLTSATCPGFRGLTSIFFVGSLAGGRGFYWTANSPFLQTIWARVRRQPKGLSTAYNPAPNANNVADANPASIIYECLTNTDWGMGCSSTLIDVDSFNTAAATLFSEELFLSMIWARSDTIENFIAQVLNHINGMLFTNPQTGLLTLKLLRADYDINSLPEINPDNATISNFKRKLYGETTNEIVVTYTDPANEQPATVTVQDLANIQIQNGGLISDSRNYYGVRNPLLAARLGERDLRIVSLPLIACEAQVNRSEWTLVPGAVVNLVFPKYGVESVIMRVMKVDYGKPTDAKIKLVLAQDVFGVQYGDYTQDGTNDSLWVDPAEDPRPVDYPQVITAPAYLLAQAFGDDPTLLGDSEVFAAVLAAQDSKDTWRYDLFATDVFPTGTSDWQSHGTKDILGGGSLAADLAAEATSVIDPFASAIGPTPNVNDFVFIGTGTDDQTEIAVVADIDGTTGQYTLWRGILDTTPKAWPFGTRVWVVPGDGARIIDNTTRADGETANFKLLTRTSNGRLDIADAPTLSGTLNNRPHLPTRPANVKVNGTGFDTYDAAGLSTVTVSWVNRNRLMETTQILQWDSAGSITPETDQTTTIECLDADGMLLAQFDGLTGTSYSLELSNFGSNATGIVRVSSKRDGDESLQAHEIQINLGLGYGQRYGVGYGGESYGTTYGFDYGG